jgi:uncharacterized protein YdeI (YjbR/CyaY-like superfamily)
MVEVSGAAEWRAWLAANHDHAPGAWLVYFKPHTSKPCASYAESVEEALCFGWVDNLVRKLDEDRYARRFIPRRPDSNWSASNRDRVRRLVAEGRMEAPGLALVEAARRSGHWRDHQPPEVSCDPPNELLVEFDKDPKARGFYDSLTDRQRTQFITWINLAKRSTTRARRIAETMQLLRAGRKLGMK